MAYDNEEFNAAWRAVKVVSNDGSVKQKSEHELRFSQLLDFMGVDYYPHIMPIGEEKATAVIPRCINGRKFRDAYAVRGKLTSWKDKQTALAAIKAIKLENDVRSRTKYPLRRFVFVRENTIEIIEAQTRYQDGELLNARKGGLYWCPVCHTFEILPLDAPICSTCGTHLTETFTYTNQAGARLTKFTEITMALEQDGWLAGCMLDLEAGQMPETYKEAESEF